MEEVRDPIFADGLPNVGLVGEIATDYLITHWEMADGVDVTGVFPDLTLFAGRNPEIKSPVRL